MDINVLSDFCCVVRFFQFVRDPIVDVVTNILFALNLSNGTNFTSKLKLTYEDFKEAYFIRP